LLDEARIISTQQGRGTYIWEQPTPEGLERLRQQEFESLTHHYLREVERLGYSPEHAMGIVQRQVKTWHSSGTITEDK